jgi:hypothetical protein
MKFKIVSSALGVLSYRATLGKPRPRAGTVVVKVSPPFRQGLVLPQSAAPGHLADDEVVVRWLDGGEEVELVKSDHLCPVRSGEGSRVMRSAGGPRRYGRIPLPGKVIGLRRKASALGPEWTVVRWDDGQFEITQENQLTYLPEL